MPEFKSTGSLTGANVRFAIGQKPTEVFDSGSGGTVFAEFNGFAFNAMEFNGVNSGTGGQSAIPVIGVGSSLGPVWKFATGGTN